VVTAEKLHEKMRRIAATKPIYSVPNGCDWEHFASTVKLHPDRAGKRMTLGYIGAFAPWVDQTIIEALSRSFSHSRILIAGPDLRENKRQFNSNVELIGYQNYEQLPALLEQIDVCLIPFKINRITESSNPVKVYEYLAAGKPVVSTNLPEVRKLQPYVRLANTPESFVNEVRKAYSIRGKQVKERSQYAARFSWKQRYKKIERMLEEHFPGFSSSCGPVPKIPTYSASSFSLEHCTLNSYYKNKNLSQDPPLIGSKPSGGCQCLFQTKNPLPGTFVKAYLDFRLTLPPAVNPAAELILQATGQPWVRTEVSFASQPPVTFLASVPLEQTLQETVSLVVTRHLQAGKPASFHLSTSYAFSPYFKTRINPTFLSATVTFINGCV
jgi:Glycosyl transferases group 1